MSCEFCIDPNNLEKILDVLGDDTTLRYCPACGEDIKITHFIVSMEKAIQDAWNKVYLQHARISEENTKVEIDGEILEFERIPSPEKNKKAPVKPRSMAVDLDNINIDREMKLLYEHHTEPMRRHVAERIKDYVKEKENERDFI